MIHYSLFLSLLSLLKGLAVSPAQIHFVPKALVEIMSHVSALVSGFVCRSQSPYHSQGRSTVQYNCFKTSLLHLSLALRVCLYF